MKNLYKNLFTAVLVLASSSAFCHDLQTAVERESAQARLVRSARVNLTFKYKKDFQLSEYVHRRRIGFHNVVVKTETKEKKCIGVLLDDLRVATLPECAVYKDFELVQVHLSLTNGKTGNGGAGTVSVNNGIAYIQVSGGLVQGLRGLKVAYISGDKSLQDVYGAALGKDLQAFLLGRGVLTHRARRMGYRPHLEKGEPFIWKGRVVALFNSVPKRLPVSLFGQFSEHFLSAFRY